MQYSLGIDLGGSHIAAALVDETGQLRHKDSYNTDISRGLKGIAADIVSLAESVLGKLSAGERSTLTHIGVGVPGPVHPENGHLIYAANLNLKDADLKSEIAAHFPRMEIRILNDADCATWAEYKFGALQDYPNSLLLTLGTGMGGGFILDGKVFSGATGFGFEPGHMTIAADGLPCTCGRKGCWENYVSSRALRQEADKALQDHPDSLLLKGSFTEGKHPYTIRKLFAAAEAGDLAALHSIDSYTHYLAIGIASLTTILQPEIIALGGGISERNEDFYNRLQESVAAQLVSTVGQPIPKIVPAKLGNNAGIVGAAIWR